MKVWEHFRTITAHKLKVMLLCFRVGLFKQGLLHDMSKYTPTEFLRAAVTIREPGAPTPGSARWWAIPRPGCITRGEISITLNTGRIFPSKAAGWPA